MIHIIYIYLMINCFIAGGSDIDADSWYSPSFVLGIIIMLLFALPICIVGYIYQSISESWVKNFIIGYYRVWFNKEFYIDLYNRYPDYVSGIDLKVKVHYTGKGLKKSIIRYHAKKIKKIISDYELHRANTAK